MTCPNGLTIPFDGFGGWCIGDPVSTSELDPLYDSIDLSLDTSVSIEVEVILQDAADSDAVVDALNVLLNNHGLPDVSATDILAAASTIDLPLVSTPNVDSDNDDSSDNDSSNASVQCSTYLACEVCAIWACVSAISANNCEPGYETSDGGYYRCASCQDCYATAKAATQHCCPIPQ